MTLIIGGILGVFLVYVLTITGADFWRIKGLASGLLYYVAFWGLLRTLGTSTQAFNDLGSNLFNLLSYPLWGYLAAAFSVRWGDQALFSGIRKLD